MNFTGHEQLKSTTPTPPTWPCRPQSLTSISDTAAPSLSSPPLLNPTSPTSQLNNLNQQLVSSYCPPPTPNPPSIRHTGQAPVKSPCPAQRIDHNKGGNDQPPTTKRNTDHTRNTPKKSFCSREFQGKGKCEKKDGCNERHDIDFRKLRRGICFNEFFKRGSCRNGEHCQYCHQIPDSVRSDPEIMKNIDEKIQKSYEKKAEGEKTRNTKTSNNTTGPSDNQDATSDEEKTRLNQVPPPSCMVNQNSALSDGEEYRERWIPNKENLPMDQQMHQPNVVYDNTTYLPSQVPTNSNLMYSYWPPLTPENKPGSITSAGLPYHQVQNSNTQAHFLSQVPQPFTVLWHHPQQSQPLQRRM